MATRKLRVIGDPVLKKKCKPVIKLTPNLEVLIDDMFETMHEAMGVGLAAPQVGILRRLCVVDVMDGEPLVLINPELLESSGEQTDEEGCLSVPGKVAFVTRPMNITVKYQDREMNEKVLEAEGLKARCILHEMDHLDGVLYGDVANEPYRDLEETEDEEFEEE